LNALIIQNRALHLTTIPLTFHNRKKMPCCQSFLLKDDYPKGDYSLLRKIKDTDSIQNLPAGEIPTRIKVQIIWRESGPPSGKETIGVHIPEKFRDWLEVAQVQIRGWKCRACQIVYFQRIPLLWRDTGRYHLKSVGNAIFCISDTPVFHNHLISLETAGIRAFPPEINPGHFFYGLTK
jgi:hypothetical protein